MCIKTKSINYISLIPAFAILVTTYLYSCRSVHKPTVITKELLCELQDIFNGVRFSTTFRPCNYYEKMEYYKFNLVDSHLDSEVIQNQILQMKDRYGIKYTREQRSEIEQYAKFEKYLSEMEKYGIKCIDIRDWLEGWEDRLVYTNMPCKKYATIHFYADRISLSAYPMFDTIDLSKYESVAFSTSPFIKDTSKITTRLPGTFWVYEFYKKPDKHRKKKN